MPYKTFKSNALLGFAVLTAIAIIQGCSNNKSTNPPSSGPPPSHLISIHNLAFSPTPDTVVVGDTVTWRNMDGIQHTVTSDSTGGLDSGPIDPNGTYQHIFASAGIFTYHCMIHPQMHGRVVVVTGIPANPHPGSKVVTIQNFTFTPSPDTVSVGDTLAWTNADPL